MEALCKQRGETADYARGLKRWCLQDCSLMISKDEHFITAISFRFKIFMHVICLTWCVGTAWRQVCIRRRHLWHRWNLLQCCHRWGQSFVKKVGEDMWLCVGWEGLWLCLHSCCVSLWKPWHTQNFPAVTYAPRQNSFHLHSHTVLLSNRST